MVNEGTLSAIGGGILTFTDPLAQDGGAFTVDATSTASVTGAVSHSGGVATIDGGLTAGSYEMAAGTISGGGTLTAPLSTIGAAAVSPSGTLDVDGTVSLDGATLVASSIASTASVDQLHSTGAMTLTDAALQVTFTGTPRFASCSGHGDHCQF